MQLTDVYEVIILNLLKKIFSASSASLRLSVVNPLSGAGWIISRQPVEKRVTLALGDNNWPLDWAIFSQMPAG